MELDTQPSEDRTENTKLFYINSRNSSVNSLVDVEDSAEFHSDLEPLTTPTKLQGSKASCGKEKHRKCRPNVNGRCLCKLSVVLYLATCIVVSALYVVFFGRNEAFFGDAWIPGKVINSWQLCVQLPYHYYISSSLVHLE